VSPGSTNPSVLFTLNISDITYNCSSERTKAEYRGVMDSSVANLQLISGRTKEWWTSTG
jgi:hypothetical protein